MQNHKMHAHHASGGTIMAMLTVRNISEEVHRALRARAARHGQSMEAEVREILEAALSPQGRLRLGTLLADMGRQAKLSDQEFAVFEQVRDKTPARPVNFE
jgi:plasmid stability protein